MVKLPRTPPDQLHITDGDLTDWTGPMVRIHGTAGPHLLSWHQLRHFGPLPARFDPHPPPTAHHAHAAVMYVADNFDTALAEDFQATRTVSPSAPNRPYLTVWHPTRSLRLLDVTGTWPIRNGASHALNTGPHSVCRAWARAVAADPADVDGLTYSSAMTGGPAAALFQPAADSFPTYPELSLPLDHPGLARALYSAASRIGYDIG